MFLRGVWCVVLLLLTGFVFSSCSSSQGETGKDTLNKKTALETTPILAVVGFGVERTSIPLEELKQKFCKGEVFVLEASKQRVSQVFSCSNAKIVKNIRDFAPLAKENILMLDLENASPQFKALAIDSIDFFRNPQQYPLYALGDEKEKFDFQDKITKFTLTGTTAITRHMGRATSANGMDWLIANIINEVKSSDFLHVSNEVSAKPDCEYVSGMRFCTKTEHLEVLNKLGVDIVELTGNHNLDHGKEPYIETMKWYKSHQMQTFGGGLSPEEAYKPFILKLKDGKKIALIGFNESCPVRECAGRGGNTVGAAPYDSLKVAEIIKNLKNNPEISYIMASVQFDEVDSYNPTKSQLRKTKYLIDCGADFVYGSQAHQVQQVEFYKGKPIFHGLGNFLFDQIHRIGVRQGFFLHNYFYKGKIVQAVPVYTFTAQERRPALAKPEEIKGIQKVIFSDKNLYQ